MTAAPLCVAEPGRRERVAPPAACSVTEALEQLRAGRLLVLFDGDRPEDGGVLLAAAELIGPASVNFMARYGGGVVSLCLTPERCEELGLHPMCADDRGGSLDAMLTIEARTGVTTGISAADRARTIAVAVDPGSARDALVVPGHVLPLRAAAGGVRERPGPVEAAVDVARLAGLAPAGVTCAILGDDGETTGARWLGGYCARHGLRMLDVRDLVEHMLETPPSLARVADAALPTAHGRFRIVGFRDGATGADHVALVRGRVAGAPDALVHVERECLFGHVLRARDCGCRDRLDAALERCGAAEHAVLVYVREPAAPTCASADAASVERVAQEILSQLGVARLRPSPLDHVAIAGSRGRP